MFKAANQTLDQKPGIGQSEIEHQEPKRFTERNFSEYIARLCEINKHDVAERYFLSHLKNLLATGINPKEKINNLLYLSRIIQSGSSTKHGYHKLIRKARGLTKSLEGYGTSAGGFVEFGCGAHDPIALSMLHYLNGFAPCHAVDLLKPRNEIYSALSMYDIVTNVRCFPDRYCFPGTSVEDIDSRIRQFDLEAFESGDFWGGFERVRRHLRYEPIDILESGIEECSISRFASFAVLEHVDNIDSICKKLYEIVCPDGIVYHFVDLVDHRAYRRDSEFNSFTFLTDRECSKGYESIAGE